MLQERRASKLYYRICCGIVFFIAASASFNGYFDKWHFREAGVVLGASDNATDGYGFKEILDGTAARPYIYRRLLPDVANWLNKITPEDVKDQVYNFRTNQGRLADVMLGSSPSISQNHVYAFRYLVLEAIVFFFAWLSVYAMYLVCRALGFRLLISIFAPTLMILLVPYFMSVGGYMWDYPELAFMALTIWMALKFDWWWILPLAVLGAWNKESFVIFTLTLYPLLRSRSSQLSASIGAGILFAVSLIVYIAIRAQFVHNSGGTVMVEWIRQIVFFLRPVNFIDVEMTYGIITFRVFTLLPVILIVWGMIRSWHKLPKTIRQHAKIAAGINFPLYFLFCAPGELRDLSMLYVTFMLSLAVNLMGPARRMLTDETPAQNQSGA